MFCIAGETFHVYFLGTAGALPTPQRNPSCIMVRRGSDTLLFDCGEGTQQQMMRARTGFTIDAIFITHWHADHFLGIFGLVETLGFMGRNEPLPIFGPAWVNEVVKGIYQLSKHNVSFPISAHELSDGDVIPFAGYHVRAFRSDHGTDSLGYIVKEDDRPGKFNRERAIELGVRAGPLFGKLQRGESVCIRKNGQELTIHPGDVLGPPRPGRTMVYTGDTRPQYATWIEWARDADLLIHDATFDDAGAKRAAEVYHSTAGEAAEVAQAIGAHRLALVHISSRYSNTANHIEDAKKRFQGEVIVPDDLTVLELQFRG